MASSTGKSRTQTRGPAGGSRPPTTRPDSGARKNLRAQTTRHRVVRACKNYAMWQERPYAAVCSGGAVKTLERRASPRDVRQTTLLGGRGVKQLSVAVLLASSWR